MGVKVTKATNVFVDNMLVALSSKNPGSPLNKKMVALLYHFVQKHAANGAIIICKIKLEHNYVDAWTKGLNSTAFHEFFHHLLCN